MGWKKVIRKILKEIETTWEGIKSEALGRWAGRKSMLSHNEGHKELLIVLLEVNNSNKFE